MKHKPSVAQVWLLLLCAATLLLGCANGAPPPPPEEHVHEGKSALFTNGDFEAGSNNQPPPSWTVTPFSNQGVTIQTPQTRAGLNLSTSGSPTARTFTLVTAAGPESQIDPSLGAGASLRWPKFGNAVAIVNQQGNQRNVNSMKQTMTVAAGDIDSLDGLAHVRFVLAPVLQDPSHTPDEQPYFFVQLTNLSKGNAILYQDFNFANQPGVPWKTAGTNLRYTDWSLVDIAPGSALMNIGDQVELEVIAAGCSLNAHWGQVYVDSIGPDVPGLFVTATGPAAANANTDITYTLTYKNGGAAGTNGTVVEFNTPPNTTFTSFNAPGLSCIAPAAGSAGKVTCTVGALAAGASGSFQITVHIDPAATGTITAGNYDIFATGISPLLGPKVYTTITTGVAYADLAVTVTDGATTVVWGQPVSYQVVVTNNGPNAVIGATVSDPLPANFTNMAWSCVAAGGGTCAASGTGAINDTVDLPVGATLTYTVTGTVANGTGSGTLFNVVTVAVPPGASDPTPANNSAGDSNVILAPNGVGCTLSSDCVSAVCDPANNTCGWLDGNGPCTTATGPIVCQSGVCSPNGGVCIPPGGCAVDADCSTTEFCNTQTLACVPKLPNSTPIPTIAGHTPTLDGTCTAGAGASVCVSAVCDVNDDQCGYANGDGPCTTANGAVVCRSGMCSATAGVCIPPGGCAADADCNAAQFCNTQTFACTPKLPNGNPIPTITGHTPPLTGLCTPGAGASVCVAGVCDTGDQQCGYANGSGPCTAADATVVCRSGMCSADGTCVQAGGCNVDADCSAAQWCNISMHACAPKVGNGGVMPTDPGHSNPVVNGDCTVDASALVCVSAVCDTADDRCGYANGTGTCTTANGATICRSAVCDDDGKCGYVNGHGPCTQGNGHVVCRSGACSPNGAVCMPIGGCAVDADCGASEWCNTEVFACAPKLPNGTDIPTVAGHTPLLGGTCTPATGASVCASGVCDTSDDKCGLVDGTGPCTTATGIVVCRSGSCTSNGVCGPSTACNTDSECDTGTQYCDTGAHVCAPKKPNGSTMPTVPGHTPTLDGNCDTTQAPVVCQSAVCDTNDDKCGYDNGSGPCTVENAGVVCRSSTCSPNGGVCVPSGGCAVDADCGASEWCNTELFACLPKLPNGTDIPTVGGHTPALTGTCTTGAGASVCASGVCDITDDKCGYANGNGPCTAADAAIVCREGACTPGGVCTTPVDCVDDSECDTATQYCDTGVGQCAPKLPNGTLMPGVPGHSPVLDGTCSDASAQIVCQSGVCDAADNKCGHAIGEGPCDAATGPVVCRSMVCATSGANAGLCVECVADGQCAGSIAVCDTAKNACVQCTTAEDEACTGATPVCVSGPGTCAPCDGDLGSGTPHACSDSGTPLCVLAGLHEGECIKCSSNADCAGNPSGPICDTASGACTDTCHVDADCAPTDWCNAPTGGDGNCVPKLDNGTPLPGGPPEVVTCTAEVGVRVCKSGVCDPTDNTCGLANGNGPCTDGVVCRSGACDPDGKCGLVDGGGPCTSDAVCRGGKCDLVNQVCGGTPPGCQSDSECKTTEFCAPDGACKPKLDDGKACTGENQCKSGACNEKICDSILASGNGVVCAARPGAPSGDGAGLAVLGLMLASAGLARRRRRR